MPEAAETVQEILATLAAIGCRQKENHRDALRSPLMKYGPFIVPLKSLPNAVRRVGRDAGRLIVEPGVLGPSAVAIAVEHHRVP